MLLASQFNSVRNMPRLSKRAMLAKIEAPVAQAKQPARNTLDYTDAAGVRRIRLHATDILTIRPDGSFMIDTGGWNTHTTRARLNDHLPRGWRVHTDRGSIHLTHGRYDEPGRSGAVFRKTVTVTKRGAIKPDVSPLAEEKLKKQIDAYMAAFRKRGLPSIDDSGGDPWVIGAVSAETMLDWIKSRYVFRLMLILAFRHAGVADSGIGYCLHDYDHRGLDKFAYGRIRRYIRFCVGLAS